MSKSSSGRIWPYIIGGSITLVFGFCVATIVVTQSAHIQPSDTYMTYYQNADANVNKLIEARIAFDKKYKIEYLADGISAKDSVIKYKVTDVNGKSINSAKMLLATSRPETDVYNQKLESASVTDGVYSFKGAEFPKVGVWNLIAKVTIGSDSRYYNIKADTRIKEAFEF